MRNGFRVPAQPSKKEAQRKVDTELANLQMAGRVSQMMIKQMMENMQSMSRDLGNSINQFYELQYKLDALIKQLNVDTKQLNDIANEKRLSDFNAASIKEDASDKLLVADEVSADSTVVITSTAQDADGTDKGIFRSRLKLSESGVPDLISALQAKKVGDKVTVKLNGLDHLVELLAIRNPSPQPETTPAPLEVVQ